MPALGGYSATKAAAFSLTQSLRIELRPRGVAVHAVFPGPIDTAMVKWIWQRDPQGVERQFSSM
jgi:short-subunit dehydrogenase